MNVKRLSRLTLIIASLTLIMFKFQNCAAPTDQAANYDITSDDQAGLIDDLANRKLAFVENLIVLKHDKNTINFDGLCNKETNGKEVSWEIYSAENDDLIQDGLSKCIRGGFRITSDQINQLTCNMDYKLEAYVGENTDSVLIRKKCQPMNVVQDVSKKEVFGRECFFELETAGAHDEPICYRSCYSSGKLYDREITQKNNCKKQ